MPSIRVKGSNFKFKFNRTAFTKAMQKKLAVATRQSARAFLREAIRNVPVLTGMARGSLRPLGQFLKAVAVPIKPTLNRAGRGIAAGEAEAFKGKPIEITSTSVTFQYSTGVLHYLLNEFTAQRYPNGQLPTPWSSFAKGMEKYKEEFDIQIHKKFPNVFDFISSGDITG